MKRTFVAALLLTTAVAAPAVFAQSPGDAPLKVDGLDIVDPTLAPAVPGTDGVTLDATGQPATPAKDAVPEGATPTPPPTAAANIPLPDIAKDLTPAEQEKLRTLLAEASSFVQGIRIQEALERIFEAKNMVPDYHVVHNLEGAAWTKAREFDKARAAFERCLALNPESLEARFNIAELDFVSRNYDQARNLFNGIIKNQPRFPARTRNLILFKIYLCSLMLDDNENAGKLLASFNYMSDTPEYYYANAAKSFHAGDKEDARSWLRSAGRIYDRGLQDLFVDSLVELGFVETL